MRYLSKIEAADDPSYGADEAYASPAKYGGSSFASRRIVLRAFR
jgi:hypothetical protein